MPENDKKEDSADNIKKDEVSKKVASVNVESKKDKPAEKVTKVAEAGKVKKKPMTKVDIKNMSKLEAQKIINEKDPDLLQRIENEVAAKAKVIKRRVMVVGFVVIVVAVGYIVYQQMQKKKKRASLPDRSQQEMFISQL